MRQADYQQLEVLNSMLQLIMIASLLFALLRKTILFYTLLLLELILNFLCCTPYYMVSSYSAAEVNQMYSYTRGFPVQQKPTYHLPVEISGKGTTVWRNINTSGKDVSTEISMPGPLVLEKVGQFLSSPGKESLIERKLVFIRGESVEMDTVNIIQQGYRESGRKSAIIGPSRNSFTAGIFPRMESVL